MLDLRSLAISIEKYDKTPSAPERLKEINDSIIALLKSMYPFFDARVIIEYSPDT
jgi:hypothetical protein